ncbi:hypothetical protein D1953_20435 [Peribacillus asahii]|uniref:Uncharacterized protein n=1 Tax=Peribacillus asahii TaxID=228899 RepID=A0A398AXU0_9BACI|nr:hypothetical protein [Peribacillus asahii]RID81558.1 hypothetical protein D1953_20435 [Peribacillus asahii]
MVNWRQIQEKGKKRFVLLSGLVLSMPLALDYYIIKFLISSFRIDFAFIELLTVWIICLLSGLTFALYGWSRMEKDWLNNNSLFK